MSGVTARMRQIGAHWAFGTIAAIATGVLITVLHRGGQALCHETYGAPLSNLPLQQAWTLLWASVYVDAWQGCESKAAFQVWLDYPFILAYASFFFFLGLRCEHAAARRGMSSLALVARRSAWGGLVAGLFDCLENVGLLDMILREPAGFVPLLTSVCSTLKFVLIGNSLFVGANVGVAVFSRRFRQQPAAEAG